MAGAKEIRGKINSFKSTQKITKAMEMVAASKMRKAQERMRVSRPYAEKMYTVVKHLAYSHSEYHHPAFMDREIKRVGYIVVSTDRGLCGGLNANMFKAAANEIKHWQDLEVGVDCCLIGRKAEGFFRRNGGNILALADQIGDAPTVQTIIGVVKIMLDKFYSGEIDAVYVIFNRFVNSMSQTPVVQKLLPLPKDDEEGEKLAHHWDYIYEPDAKELLEAFMSRYIESEVYQAIVENIACEQSARMLAMKSASDNAGDLIDHFQLVYNKARQAAITQEISEIVSGASAV